MATPAVIRFPTGDTASFDGAQWTTANADRAKLLNAHYTVANLEARDPWAYHPNIIAEVAAWAAEALGATVESAPETPADTGVDY